MLHEKYKYAMPYEVKGEAYKIHSGIMLFHDWRFVSPAYPYWVVPEETLEEDKDMKELKPGMRGEIFNKTTMPDYTLECKPSSISGNLSIKANLPELVNEEEIKHFDKDIIQPFRSFELFDEGKYKRWYLKAFNPPIEKNGIKLNTALCYTESIDRINWEKPPFKHVHINSDIEKNAVHIPMHGFDGFSIFKDPSAPDNERYKAFYLGVVSKDAEKSYLKRRPGDADSLAYIGNTIYGVRGLVSPDGIYWKDIPEPLLIHQSDTTNICHYNTVIKKYVAYVRTRYMNRRAIGITVSEDFRNFPPPVDIIMSDSNMSPTHEWYGPGGVSSYPGTDYEYNVMFPFLWNIDDDCFYTYIASSINGVNWNIHRPGVIAGPSISRGPRAGGIIFRGNLFELPDGKIALNAISYSMPHKYPYRPAHPRGQMFLAVWPKDRVIGLSCEGTASFRTPLISYSGEEIRINAITKYSGAIKVQITDEENRILTGNSFDEFDTIRGDFDNKLLTWKGSSLINIDRNKPIKIWFRMQNAQLYSLRFV